MDLDIYIKYCYIKNGGKIQRNFPLLNSDNSICCQNFIYINKIFISIYCNLFLFLKIYDKISQYLAIKIVSIVPDVVVIHNWGEASDT